MDDVEFNIRLDTVEKNIAKNIELTSENIKLTSLALEEMRKVTDKFGVHVDYLTRDNERLREESDRIHEQITLLDGRIRELGLEVIKLSIHGTPPETEVNLDKKMNTWATETFGKWVIGIMAAAVGGLISLVIRSMWRGQ